MEVDNENASVVIALLSYAVHTIPFRGYETPLYGGPSLKP